MYHGLVLIFWRYIVMSDIQKLRFYTDESGIPYEDGENPFPRTKEDDDFDQMMIEKYNLVLKEAEDQRNNEVDDMGEFLLELSKDYFCPVVKVSKIEAMISTDITIPVFFIPLPIVELAFNAKMVLNDAKIFGFCGECHGKVYEMDKFEVGKRIFEPFQFFVPDNPVSKHPILLPASMFYGMKYEFDTIQKVFKVKYLEKEELYRSFQLRNLDRKLVAQVNDTLIPDDTYEPLKEYDNYTQVSFSEFTQNDVDPDKKTLLSSHVIQIKN